MRFFLHILPEIVSALFSIFIEWFLFHEQPALYGGELAPLTIAWSYTALLLAVWILPIYRNACRRRGGIFSTALNLLPAEIIFGVEFVCRLPLAGTAVFILLCAATWLIWYERYRRNVSVWDEGKRGTEYSTIRRKNRQIAVRLFVLTAMILLLIPSLYSFHVVRAEKAQTATTVYETHYEADPSFLVDLKNTGLIGTI